MRMAAQRRWQEGAGVLATLAILVGVVVGGFLLVKFVGAYIDVNGMESDLNALANDLAVECVGDPSCEDTLVAQIEDIRQTHGRDIDLDYSTLDYAAATNKLFLQGNRVIDLKLHKLTWRFTLVIERML